MLSSGWLTVLNSGLNGDCDDKDKNKWEKFKET